MILFNRNKPIQIPELDPKIGIQWKTRKRIRILKKSLKQFKKIKETYFDDMINEYSIHLEKIYNLLIKYYQTHDKAFLKEIKNLNTLKAKNKETKKEDNKSIIVHIVDYDILEINKHIKTLNKLIIITLNSSFKSEIDWGRWNRKTPRYPKLINEYNKIEEISKKNGTWIKNSDGSVFEGTPEQFIQQQSSWFKKNMPNIIRNKFGRVQINYHGQRSGRPFNIFKELKRTRNGSHGKGIYTFAGNKKEAITYVNSLGKKGTLYELYINSNNPQKTVKSVFSDDFNEVSGILQRGFDYIRVGKEQVIPFTNYPKSAVGNVGFFDMTNPNIYK